MPAYNPEPAAKAPLLLRRKGVIAVIVVVLIAGWGIARRIEASSDLYQKTEDQAIASVMVMKALSGPAEEEIVLPGNVEAWHQATLYARTNGYVKRWVAAFGTHVHKGDELAEIETPEVDAQLRQAEADLKTAQANNDLAQITAQRWKNLLKTDSVSQQETDEKTGDAKAKEAAVASAKASRDHLRELSDFKIVKAPFDGIVSSRLLDVGMLVTSGNDIQQSLFTMVQSDRLRIYVKIPENYSSRVNSHVYAELHFTEHPGEVFKAKFYKSALALDPPTRTLLTEFVEDNRDGKLFAGGYAEVHIKLPSAQKSLRLPVNTLIFRAAGLQVATVDDKGRVALRKVVMGRDFGNEVEINSGLSMDERIIVNPPDSLADGQQVHVIEPKKEDSKKDEKKS